MFENRIRPVLISKMYEIVLVVHVFIDCWVPMDWWYEQNKEERTTFVWLIPTKRTLYIYILYTSYIIYLATFLPCTPVLHVCVYMCVNHSTCSYCINIRTSVFFSFLVKLFFSKKHALTFNQTETNTKQATDLLFLCHRSQPWPGWVLFLSTYWQISRSHSHNSSSLCVMYILKTYITYRKLPWHICSNNSSNPEFPE